MNEPLSDDLKEIAIAAERMNKEAWITVEDMYEMVAEGIRKVPEQLQMMLDSVVSMQGEFPMPRDGWEAFVRSIQHTNEKHGFNLVIKPELLYGGLSLNNAYKTYAESVNKGVEELKEEDKKQAILNAVLSSESHELDIIGPVKESDFEWPNQHLK